MQTEHREPLFRDYKQRAHAERAAYLKGLISNVPTPPSISPPIKRGLGVFTVVIALGFTAFWSNPPDDALRTLSPPASGQSIPQ